MFVRDGSLLLDWPTHLERLVRSLQALHKAVSGFYSTYYAWLEATGSQGNGEADALQRLLAPAVQEALSNACEASQAAQHLMLIIVLPPAPSSACGLDVRVHASACGPLGSSTAGSAVVAGGPRSVPVGKDSGWVLERLPLEQHRPAGAAEVLLSTQDGRLLEGLVTNLFLVVRRQPSEPQAKSSSGIGGSTAADAASAASGVPGSDELVVWTAGMQDGVVWGTVRARVLEACRRLGLAVREEAPHMSDRGCWQEAFLTNSMRLIQPLNSISCSADNMWGHAPWAVEFPAAPRLVTAALQAALLTLLPACDAAQL